MRVSMKSDNYNIISHGETFLFDKSKDLTINIEANEEFSFSVVLKFMQDETAGHRIEQTVIGNEITLFCINFHKNGTGLSFPVQVAEVDGKKIYFMFWSFLNGDKGEVRSVKYTFFCES